jgi:DNA-binding NarL/FixJ family response regulator
MMSGVIFEGKLKMCSDSQHPGVVPETTPIPDSASITALIADETRMGAQLLKNELARSRHRINVVAAITSQTDIFRLLNADPADIALINENPEEGSYMGFQILAKLRESYPKTRVILLLKSAPHDLVVDAFRGGVKGVFCRTETPEALSKCVRAVHGGQIWVNSNQLHFVLEELVNAKPLRVADFLGRRLLTKRQDEVVNLVVEGVPNSQIAQKLGVTEHTVNNYLFRIYEKLGISSRTELVLYALKQSAS